MRLHGAAFVLLMSLVLVALAWCMSLIPPGPVGQAFDAHGNESAVQSR